jgi:hypothetical protein
MSKTIQVKCSCLEVVRDVSRTKRSPISYNGQDTYHPDDFLTEESAILGWNFHKKQMKLEFPNSALDLCKVARLIITETKTIQ